MGGEVSPGGGAGGRGLLLVVSDEARSLGKRYGA